MTRGGVRVRAAAFAAAAALLLAGCGERTPPLPPLDASAVVLAFGDSLTFGTGAADGESYPAQLERLIGRKVVAQGVPGEVSAQGLARLPGVLDATQPKLLLLCHGGNDFLRKLPETEAAANVRAMVRLAREKGIAVVLIGVPKPGLSPSPAAFYADIAKQFAVPYEGSVLKTVLADNALKSDWVHPNAKGYARVAQAMAELLKKSEGGPMTSRYAAIAPYVTKDGSEIRELMHPAVHGNRAQSLAEATVPPRAETLLHRHRITEELYHVTAGVGLMTLGERSFEVRAGDTVCIPPGTPHRIRNTGAEPLRILCCCSPAYSHEDTELL